MNDNSTQSAITTSALLEETLNGLEGSHVTVGELMKQFQRRSFGGVLLILALLAMVPGVSVFAGIAMIAPAFQLFAGMPTPVFPAFIHKREVNVANLKKWGLKLAVWLRKIETLVIPRWPTLSTPVARRIIGAITVLLAIVVAIPFPLSNFPPALATVCFALGILERDGLMIIIGSLISVVAFLIGFTVFYIGISWLTSLF